MSPTPDDKCPEKQKRRHGRKGDSCVKTEAEAAATQPRAMERPKLAEAERGEEGFFQKSLVGDTAMSEP